MGVLRLQPTAGDDTYISENASSSNFGTMTNLAMGDIFSATNDRALRALVRFHLSPMPSDAVVTSASLTLYAINATNISTPTSFTVHRTTSAWTSAGATWLSKDGSTLWGTTGGDFVALAADAYSVSSGSENLVFSNLAAEATYALASASAYLSLIVRGPESGTGGQSKFLNVASSDHLTVSHPLLVVHYTSATEDAIHARTDMAWNLAENRLHWTVGA